MTTAKKRGHHVLPAQWQPISKMTDLPEEGIDVLLYFPHLEGYGPANVCSRIGGLWYSSRGTELLLDPSHFILLGTPS